jgi:hypothetical protein
MMLLKAMLWLRVVGVLGCAGADTDPDSDAPGWACEPRDTVMPTESFFADISDASGIRVDNFDPEPPAGMVINDHSRLAFADLNGDGWDDVVMHSLYPNATNGVPFEHLVFLNQRDGTFREFSTESGLRDVQAAFFAFADVDNDGDQDAFAGLDVTVGSQRSAVLLNDGDGHFTPVERSGVEVRSPTAANATFADFDGDGLVDLYVGNGGTTYASKDLFYLGNGDGTFWASDGWLEGNPARPSNGTAACDFDNDGDSDVFVSTYAVSIENGHNVLWQNSGYGFENVAEELGFAALGTGNYWLSSTGFGADIEGVDPADWVGSNGFGLDCGDVDGDGDLDVFLSAISHSDQDYSRKWSDPSQLLINLGPDEGFRFENQWLERGLPYNEGDVDGALVDFDNDGRFDLSLSRDRKYESRYAADAVEQYAWFGLMHQLADGQFESLGVVSGINDVSDAALYRMKSAQNHAWSDIDHDGDEDLLVGGRDQGGGRPNFLFRNDVGGENRWLALQLEGDGVQVSRDAFGARVTLVFADDSSLLREKKSSRGMYNSEDTRTLHFGLGDRPCVSYAEVRWPDGTIRQIPGEQLEEDRYLVVSYPDVVSVRE